MSPSCPGPELLLMLRAGVLDEGDGPAELEAHVAGCAACKVQTQKLDQELVAPPLPFPSSELLAGIQARIEADLVETDVRNAPPQADLDGVHVRCTFCKDSLGAEPIYCASCLAPYHADCFAEHGRCAIAGCEGQQVVRRSAAPVAPKRLGGRRLIWGALLLSSAAAAAALVESRRRSAEGDAAAVVAPDAPDAPHAAEAPVAPEAPEDGDYEPARYAVADLLRAQERPAWVGDYRSVLGERVLDLSLPDMPLDHAVDTLHELSGLDFRLDAGVDPQQTVRLSLHQVGLGDAIQILCDELDLQASLSREAVVFAPRGSAPAGAPLLDGFEDDRVDRETLLAGVRLAVLEAAGPDAWATPASLELDGDTLLVVQRGAGHSAVRGHIAALRSSWLRDLDGAWFLPTGEARPERQAFAEALERPVDLDLKQGLGLLEALDLLRRVTPIPLHLSPEAEAHAQGRTVFLKLSAIPLRNALAIVLDQTGLEFDVGPLGIFVRMPDEPTTQQRLERLAEGCLHPETAAAQRVLALPGPAQIGGGTLGGTVDQLQALTGLNTLFDSELDRARLTRELLGNTRSIADTLRALLEPLDLGFYVSQGVVRIAPRSQVPEAPALAQLAMPFGNAAWGVGLGELSDRLHDALQVPVFLTARARASKACLAIPPNQSVSQALEFARLEASVDYGWIALDGQTFLALGVTKPEVLLASIRAVGQKSPWGGAPPAALEALRRPQRALRELLRTLAKWKWHHVFMAQFRAQLAQAGALWAEVEDAYLGQRSLATLDRERTELADLFSEHQTLTRRSWEEGDVGHEAARGRIVRMNRLPSFLDALAEKRAALIAGQAWSEAFPQGYQAWSAALRVGSSEALKRGLDALDRLGLSLSADGTVAALEQGGVSARCGLRAGDRVASVRDTAVGGSLQVLEVLGRGAEPGVEIPLRVERDGKLLELELTLDALPAELPKRTAPGGASEGTSWRATRQRLRRDALLGEGGSEGTEAAVQAALLWLQRHQNPDGSWSVGSWTEACKAAGARCEGPGWSPSGEGYRVGLTALALLAFMGRGHAHTHTHAFQPTIARALAWLLAQQHPATGALGHEPSHGESIYNHALATTALCEAYGLSGDPKLRGPAERALGHCLAAQNPGLGWKYGLRSGRNDSSVTGVMLQALIAARHAGLGVPDAALEGGAKWLRQATDRQGNVGYETPGGGSAYLPQTDGRYDLFPVMTGVSLASRLRLGELRTVAELNRASKLLDAATPKWDASTRSVNFYHWHWATQASFHLGGPSWLRWNTALQDALLPTQREGGHAGGSWDPVGEWCAAGGRVYATAINALTLEVYYREPRCAGPPVPYAPAIPERR